jgi:uncharacterized repeat protein (TIGR03943 family)
VRRETQNILLVLLGGALLKISFTGTYLRYVKPSHQWLLIVAGVVMLALAAVSIYRDLTAHRHPAPDAHDHNHSARSAWLLVLPVLAVFLVAPPALGSDSVQRAADTAPVNDGSALFPALPRADVLPLQLSEFSERAAWDSGDSLDGRRIRLTGFVVHEGTRTYVARIAIGCCAADAYPVKVELRDADLTRHPNDSWIHAVVELVPDSATKANDYIPSATVHSVQTVPEPEDPYEH